MNVLLRAEYAKQYTARWSTQVSNALLVGEIFGQIIIGLTCDYMGRKAAIVITTCMIGEFEAFPLGHPSDDTDLMHSRWRNPRNGKQWLLHLRHVLDAHGLARHYRLRHWRRVPCQFDVGKRSSERAPSEAARAHLHSG